MAGRHAARARNEKAEIKRRGCIRMADMTEGRTYPPGALKTRVGFVAALALLCASRTAAAQNADSFFFGDEAALASGAVVASGTDSGALWYNPAGFGGLRRGLISASASKIGRAHV